MAGPHSNAHDIKSCWKFDDARMGGVVFFRQAPAYPGVNLHGADSCKWHEQRRERKLWAWRTGRARGAETAGFRQGRRTTPPGERTPGSRMSTMTGRRLINAACALRLCASLPGIGIARSIRDSPRLKAGCAQRPGNIPAAGRVPGDPLSMRTSADLTSACRCVSMQRSIQWKP